MNTSQGQRLYRVALLETDWTKMQERIWAESAISERKHQLSVNHGVTLEENLSIENALRGLDVLRKEVTTQDHASRVENHWCEVQRFASRWTAPLRHTSGSVIYRRSGGDLKTTQEWLGHSSSRITADVYVHSLKRGTAYRRRSTQSRRVCATEYTNHGAS
jgi:integrase